MATATEQKVTWQPQPGSQVLFLSCPFYEALYTGTRGPGKTDALLMDFAQHVGQGFGEDWRGILFREESTQAEDLRAKAQKWFPRIFPDARYIGQPKDKWVFADGEELLFRHIRRAAEYQKYHGHEYPWVGWEELTNWPDAKCYHLMKSCNRSSNPDVPRKYRATCNPHGRGHNWIKSYFIDPAPAGVPFQPDLGDVRGVLSELGMEVDQSNMKTVAIHGHYSENRKLMEAQPDYPAYIAQAASNPEQAKAWLSDDWDIVAGGMFDDVWSRERHVLTGFEPPESWRIDRSFDWGSSAPFSVGWWAESDGTGGPFKTVGGSWVHIPAGSIVRLDEWYGWNGTPNEGMLLTDAEIGKGIVERERDMGIRNRVQPGPADSSIFDDLPGKTSPADELRARGARFVRADKSSGSVERGCEAIRRMLAEARKDRPEGKGLWVTEACRQFIRTVPTLPRDDKNMDRYDTDAEDHIADETRYRVLHSKVKSGTVKMGVL